jgi:hypothetical protein
VWVVGHIKSRHAYPELARVLSNWRPEHRRCSDGTGGEAMLEKAIRSARVGLDAAGRAALDDLEGALFPVSDAGGKPRLPRSLSPRTKPGQAQPVEARPELTWSVETMREHAWTADFAVVPEDASPPLWMSPPHEDAVCSYGWAGCEHFPDDEVDAVAWIEKVERKRLRWWQCLAIVRQLEHRADGTLCWLNIIESAARRSGKSVRIRGVALWRMSVGPKLFGERQEIVHTGSDIAVCRKAQKEAWRWCWDQGWTVTKANGKEAVENDAGDLWVIRAQDATYGWDTTLALVDEGWDVKPDTVDEGLEPSIMERSSPQLHLTSTAHRRATSMMRSRLSTALSREDGETLILVWAAPSDADVSDPAVWRAASPHWTEHRHRMIETKYHKALAGEVDPEADDPDPMAGFTAQYLNIWRLSVRVVAVGTPVVTDDDWAERIALPDDRPPEGAAISAWFSQGVTLALAWREEQGAIVSATDHPDLAAAVAALRQSGHRGRVTVDSTLEKDPALRRISTTATKARASAASGDLTRLLSERVFWHDGGEHLSSQVLDLRTQPGVDGPRVVSKGRADAVKAAAWAATNARSAQRPGGFGMVLPSSA